jgi:hypothetical protein
MSPRSYQIPAELTHAKGEMLLSVIHTFINSILNKEDLPDQRNMSIILPVYSKGNKSDCSSSPFECRSQRDLDSDCDCHLEVSPFRELTAE